MQLRVGREDGIVVGESCWRGGRPNRSHDEQSGRSAPVRAVRVPGKSPQPEPSRQGARSGVRTLNRNETTMLQHDERQRVGQELNWRSTGPRKRGAPLPHAFPQRLDLLILRKDRLSAGLIHGHGRNILALGIGATPIPLRTRTRISVSARDLEAELQRTHASITIRCRMDLPKDTEEQKLGRAGAAHARAWCSEVDHGLIFRDGEQETDFGIDAELELTGVTVSGLLVKAQIKGTTDATKLKAGASQSVSITRRTRNYWAALHLPVVVLLVDVGTKDIYWSVPSKVLGSKPASVRFSPGDCVQQDPGRFLETLCHLAHTPASAELLDQVPYFISELKRLREANGCRDSWLGLDQQEVDSVRLLYHHVLRLCSFVGATEPLLVPFPMWIARSYAIGDAHDSVDNDAGLFQAVAEELLVYAQRAYVEALVAISTQIEVAALASAHPQLTDLIVNRQLDRDHLERYIDPAESDPDWSLSFRTRPDLGPLGARERQEAFDALLDQEGLRRWPLSSD